MRNRERLVLSLSMMLAAGAMGGLLFVFAPSASANAPGGESEPVPTADEEQPPDSSSAQHPPRNFFELYPAGDDAVAYEDMEASEQQYIDNAAEWAETKHGYDVHQKWARASEEHRKRAKVKQAAQLAGTQGLDELGVD